LFHSGRPGAQPGEALAMGPRHRSSDLSHRGQQMASPADRIGGRGPFTRPVGRRVRQVAETA
jgi:hypothetical protein